MIDGARRTGLCLVAALVLAGGTACGTSAPVGTAPPPSSSSSSTSSTSTTSSTSIPAADRGFSDRDSGSSATVASGQRITVILHSSDYVFAPTSDVAVLREDGPPTVTPGGLTCTDAAGAGCGTVVASFVAVGPGEVAITADRTDCAEPACPPAAAHWTLTVHVTGDAPAESTSSTLGDPSATTTVPPAPASEAEVRGTVLFSPVCPVERIPPDPACAPRPGPADIELVHPDGTVAASTTAGDDGSFTLLVGSGAYTVRAAAPGLTIGGACQVDPAEIVVEPGISVTVAVGCDTGIR